MAAVSPQIFALETVVDVEEDGNMVKCNGKKLEGIVIDEEIGPRRQMTIEEGLRPLLTGMKLFGLYFRPPSEDLNDDSKAKRRKWNAYTIYAVSVVIVLWLNAVRMFSAFSQGDKFGQLLLNKLIIVIWSIEAAIAQTAFCTASFSGRLAIVFRQPVDDACVKHARKFSAFCTVLAWSIIVSGSTFFGYSIFFTDGAMDSTIIAPFQNHIIISYPIIPRTFAFFIAFYLVSAYIFSQATTFVLAMIFSHQFRNINDLLERCLDNPSHQVSDMNIETLRQKHQEIAMTVSDVDDSLMFSNASAFCCQLACVVVLLYLLIFYHSFITDAVLIISHVFWMFTASFGLLLTAAGGIVVHHYGHYISEKVHDINLLGLNGEAIGKVNVFLSRLYGEQIGFTVIGIFVIDKNTILTLLGLLITYFLLIVQMSSPVLTESRMSNSTVTD